MTHLDPAYCADGCGRLAETERPTGVGEGGAVTVELVCRICGIPDGSGILRDCGCIYAPRLGGVVTLGCREGHTPLAEHSSNPREDG